MGRLSARRGYSLPLLLGVFAVIVGLVVAASLLQGSGGVAHAQSESDGNCDTDGKAIHHEGGDEGTKGIVSTPVGTLDPDTFDYCLEINGSATFTALGMSTDITVSGDGIEDRTLTLHPNGFVKFYFTFPERTGTWNVTLTPSLRPGVVIEPATIPFVTFKNAESCDTHEDTASFAVTTTATSATIVTTAPDEIDLGDHDFDYCLRLQYGPLEQDVAVAIDVTGDDLAPGSGGTVNLVNTSASAMTPSANVLIRLSPGTKSDRTIRLTTRPINIVAWLVAEPVTIDFTTANRSVNRIVPVKFTRDSPTTSFEGVHLRSEVDAWHTSARPTICTSLRTLSDTPVQAPGACSGGTRVIDRDGQPVLVRDHHRAFLDLEHEHEFSAWQQGYHDLRETIRFWPTADGMQPVVAPGEELSLSHFVTTGLDVEALALFVAGAEGDQPALYNVSDRWPSSGSLVDGSFDVGTDNVPVKRIIYLPGGEGRSGPLLRFNVDFDTVNLRQEFGQGGRSNGLHVYVLRASREISFPVRNIFTAGPHWVNILVSPEHTDFLAGISPGERFIMALAWPTGDRPAPTPAPTPDPTPEPTPEPDDQAADLRTALIAALAELEDLDEFPALRMLLEKIVDLLLNQE